MVKVLALQKQGAGPKVLSIRASGIRVVNVSACSTRIVLPTRFKDGTSTTTGTERALTWCETQEQGRYFEWWMLRRLKSKSLASAAVIPAALRPNHSF